MNPFARFFQELLLYGLEKFGKYYSSYQGAVYRRDDPEGLGRIQVYCPSLYGVQAYKEWIPQKGVPAGPGYGAQCIPQIGEMVFIECLFGNPRRAVWTYGNPGYTAKKVNEKPEEYRDPDIYWFRTPGGLMVILNDTTGAIEFRKQDGTVITLDSSGMNSVAEEHNLETAEGISIRVNDSGVVIDAKTKKVYINGSNQVLYAKVSGASSITDFSEIGISDTVKVG